MSTTELKQNALKVPTGTTAERPGSPVAGDVRANTSTNKFECHDGSAWSSLKYEPDGSSAAKTAASAYAIKSLTGTTTDGLYWITVEGTPTQVYCDMNRDGGGWMLTYRCKNYNNAGGSNGTWDFPIALDGGGSSAPTSPTGDLGSLNTGLSPAKRLALWSSASCSQLRLTCGNGSTVQVDFRQVGVYNDSNNMNNRGAYGYNATYGYHNVEVGTNIAYIYANSYGMTNNTQYPIYSVGSYGCNCTEGYWLRYKWDNSSGIQIYGDGYNGGGAAPFNSWTSFWIR